MSIITSALNLTGLPQKIALGVGGAALLALGAHDVVQMVKVHRLTTVNAKLDTSIHDPKTGYIVKLTQAETNTGVCEAAIGRQNTAIRAQGTRDAATVAAVQVRYDAEHAARERAEQSAAVILAHKPQGATVADRVNDVDAQILGDLK